MFIFCIWIIDFCSYKRYVWLHYIYIILSSNIWNSLILFPILRQGIWIVIQHIMRTKNCGLCVHTQNVFFMELHSKAILTWLKTNRHVQKKKRQKSNYTYCFKYCVILLRKMLFFYHSWTNYLYKSMWHL